MSFLQNIQENKLNYAKKLVCLVLVAFLTFISIQLWLPSIFILVLVVFLFKVDWKIQYGLLLVSFVPLLLDKIGYAVGSVTQGIGVNSVAEEIPLNGLIFVIHIIHFWKKIPFPLLFYGIFLLLLGILKSKYMFLGIPLLIIGLIVKEDIDPLKIRGKTFPVMFFVLLLSVGWLVMGLNMYPTQGDLKEMQSAIDLAVTEQLPLYNDWGDGWTFVSLGYDTNYKISYPNPDYNNLPKPYLAWAKQDLNCIHITKRIQQCN